MKLLRIDTSARVRGSASRHLGDVVERTLASLVDGMVVVRRDLGAAPLPATWLHALEARATPNVVAYLGPNEGGTTDAHLAGTQLAEALTTELLEADALIVTVPMYNFGVPYQLKQWVDLVITDPRAADTAIPILAGRPALVVLAKGGAYGPGTPRAGRDHAGPWLRTVLESTWGTRLTLVDLELTMAAVNPLMSDLVPLAREIRERCVHEVEHWALQLAGECAVHR